MASACVRSFEPGATRSNFVAAEIVTLVSAPASVITVNDSLVIALIVPRIGGVFARAEVDDPVCALVQIAQKNTRNNPAAARYALRAKTPRVSNPSIRIQFSSSSLSWVGRRDGLDTLRCRAGDTYCLDAAIGFSRFNGFTQIPAISPAASTSTSTAREIFGNPGISIIFPEMTATNPAPAERVASVAFNCQPFGAPMSFGLSENEYCVLAMHTGNLPKPQSAKSCSLARAFSLSVTPSAPYTSRATFWIF